MKGRALGLLNSIKIIAFATLLYYSSSVYFAHAQSGALPVVPLPKNTQGQWIARSMSMNGFPMSIRAFSSGLKERDLVKHFRKFCRASGAPRMTNDGSSASRVLGCELNKKFYVSITLEPAPKGKKLGRARAKVDGKITVSTAPGKSKIDTSTHFPMLVGSKVVSKLVSIDGARKSLTLTIENDNPVRSNTRYIRKKLLSKGWSEFYPGDGRVKWMGVQLSFEKAGQVMQITVNSGKLGEKTVVLVHWLQ